MDINLNGIKDLVVFDRTGNRMMPFLCSGTPGNAGYVYAPEYAHLFPDLYHWAIFADYDGDGKEDIFTYNTFPPGIIVYRNVSENELEFKLQVYPFLTSNYGSGYVNILVTYADYPAIFDLDGDGDLDILTFWGLGSFVEKHRNMSMELYGHADSLVFERTDICWGYFAESEESNLITLDTCLGWHRAEGEGHRAKSKEQVEGFRHTGSTFQLLDLNGDGLTDLLLGDTDYPNLVALYNGGTADTAMMVSYEWNFPAGNYPVHLFSMPAALYADIDRDGVKDL
ncbi:MAG: VCBS repeat-containing protein, partial [Bacteroidales bacterium]|nr:VCBS repeat-containing protein [Bacteroidales bacterium]